MSDGESGPDRLRERLRVLDPNRRLVVIDANDLRETLGRLAKLEEDSRQRLLFVEPVNGGAA